MASADNIFTRTFGAVNKNNPLWPYWKADLGQAPPSPIQGASMPGLGRVPFGPTPLPGMEQADPFENLKKAMQEKAPKTPASSPFQDFLKQQASAKQEMSVPAVPNVFGLTPEAVLGLRKQFADEASVKAETAQRQQQIDSISAANEAAAQRNAADIQFKLAEMLRPDYKTETGPDGKVYMWDMKNPQGGMQVMGQQSQPTEHQYFTNQYGLNQVLSQNKGTGEFSLTDAPNLGQFFINDARHQEGVGLKRQGIQATYAGINATNRRADLARQIEILKLTRPDLVTANGVTFTQALNPETNTWDIGLPMYGGHPIPTEFEREAAISGIEAEYNNTLGRALDEVAKGDEQLKAAILFNITNEDGSFNRAYAESVLSPEVVSAAADARNQAIHNLHLPGVMYDQADSVTGQWHPYLGELKDPANLIPMNSVHGGLPINTPINIDGTLDQAIYPPNIQQLALPEHENEREYYRQFMTPEQLQALDDALRTNDEYRIQQEMWLQSLANGTLGKSLTHPPVPYVPQPVYSPLLGMPGGSFINR